MQELGAEVVGISTDDHKTQCDFAQSLAVPFPMLADEQGAIARLYDVLWPFIGLTHRVTFVIDEEGFVRGVFRHEFRVGLHVTDVLRAVSRLKKAVPVAG